MIRKTALLFVAMLAIAGTSHAGQTTTAADAWGGGVLVSVDTTSNTVVVRQGQHEQRYQLATDVRVQGKDVAGASDLDKSLGRYVSLRYGLSGDARVADRVNVLDRKGSVTRTADRAGSAAPNTP